VAAAQRRAALDRFSGNVADSVDYLLGPTGIPNRLRAANQMLNPIVALEDAMVQSGRAADPKLPVGERVRAGGSAALTTALFGIPSALAARGFIPTTTAVGETLLGISSAPRDAVLGPLDMRNRIAADEFMGRYPGDQLGSFEGAYVPNQRQVAGLNALPDLSLASPGERRYLASLSVADDMRALGATPQEVFARTGIVNAPHRDVTGAQVGPDFPLSTSGGAMPAGVNQAAVDRVMAGETVMLRDAMDLPENLQDGLLAAGTTRAPASGEILRRNEGGYFDSDEGDRIVLNTRYPDEARPTLRHEAEHLYQSESGLPGSAVGSAPSAEAARARKALSDIRNEVIAAENAYRMGDIDSTQLQEVYNAAATQRTAYSRSPFELYSENLGEVLARRAEGNASQYVTAGLREAFNPYIRTSTGLNETGGLFRNVAGAVTAPLEQAAFQASRVAGYPNSFSYGIVAQVPANIFERARTSYRTPVYVPPVRAGGPDPWANVGNDEFDFDAFD
jgi:hypothetical protein